MTLQNLQEEIVFKKHLLSQKQEKYNSMHQIEMQSGYGAQVLEDMSILKGEIKALEWVLTALKT